CSPTITFPAAESPAKSRMFWKVRATPRAAIWWAGRPSMRWSPSRMVPPPGRKRPETTLSSVVLPAPFGPMRPWTSPSPTVKVTPSRARTPPKARSTFSTQSGTCGRPPRTEDVHRRGQRGEPVRHEEDDGEEDRPVQEQAQRPRGEAQRLPSAAEQLGEQREEGRADDRAVEDRGASDDGIDEHVDGARKPVPVRRHHEGEMGLEDSGEPGERGTEREHGHFVAGSGDAHGARGGLVLPDCLE